MISGTTPISGNTFFHIYDDDTIFCRDCQQMYRFIYTKLGGQTLNVELDDYDVIAAFEDSTMEYSSLVNSYQARSVLSNVLGGQVTGNLTGKMPVQTLTAAKTMGKEYGGEVGAGGSQVLHSGSITIHAGQQNYNMNELVEIPSGSSLELRQIFHFSPVASYRFLDTNSAVNYLNNQFKFESFTPETVFYLLPIWEDVLRAQELQMGAKVRRSNYTYNLVGNILSIIPTPTESRNLFFTYYLNDANNDVTNFPDVVTNLSDIPLNEIVYSRVNSMGKQWIRRFSLELAREILGFNRGKFGGIPIPNNQVTLNSSDLISLAKDNQQNLRAELKEWLESLTYEKMIEAEANKAENIKKQFQNVPFMIYAK